MYSHLKLFVVDYTYLINMKFVFQQCNIKKTSNYLFMYPVCAEKQQRHLAATMISRLGQSQGLLY